MGRCRKLLKNFQLETILNIPGHVALANVDVWFQDEARFGQQNTTTRLWARRGSRPRAIQQQQFEYVYLFGAVCPATGTTEALLSPLVNREVMKQHLALIAARTKPGRHAVVIMVHIPVENEHLFRFKMNADSGLRVHRFRTPQCTYSDVR